MSLFRALARPRGRTRPVVAAATVAVLAAAAVAAGVTVPAAPALAADALSCDQNTLYATGPAGQFVSIDATSGAVANVMQGDETPLTPGNNALAVSRNGIDAYAMENGGSTLARYSSSTGRVTTVTNVDTAQTLIRGAENPATGLYYYGGTGGAASLGAYDPRGAGTKIGRVGAITGMQTAAGKTNGDFAFSTRGLLFVVTGDQVRRVDRPVVPTTKGDAQLSTSLVATLPSGTNSPGIAFTSDGFLYVSSGRSLMKLDPASGAQVGATIRTTASFDFTDLASCNYANTLSAQVDVPTRWKGDDQFSLAVTGGGITSGGTATTEGSRTGVQDRVAGAALTIPRREYTVTQAPAGTTRASDYSTSYRCENLNDGAVVASGAGDRAVFSFPAATSADGTDVMCTFVNTVAAVSAQASDDAGSTTAGVPLRVDAPGVLVNDAGTDLRVTSSSAPAHGTATVGPDGSYVYAPVEGFSGTDSFTYTTTDGGGGTSTSTVTVTVTPTAADDAVDARSGRDLVVGADRGVLANDSGTGLTAAVATGPQHGTLVLGADGSYRYRPEAGWSGTDTFTYTATDASGQVAGPRTVTFTVAPSAADDAAEAVSGRATTIPSTQLLANDFGTGLAVTAVSTPAHGTATVSPTGDVVYSPDRTYSGTDAFTYTVTDASGRTATATVTVTVGPDAVADTATAVAGEALDVPAGRGLLANDAGTGPLSAALADGRGPQHGSVVVNPSGSYVYAPDASYSGPDSFEYVVTDGTGATATGTVTVTVAPRATDDAYTVDAGGRVAADAPGVLDNDRGTGLVPAVTVAPRHGTATIDADGAFSYVPADGFSGDDTVTYQVTDASGGTSTATVTVTVRPTALDDLLRTPADTRVTSDATTGLLANDLGTGLRVTAWGTPRDGTVEVAEDGTWSYQPDAGTSGTDSFRYEVTDASGRTATARAWVIVGDVATDDVATARAGQRLTVSAAQGVLANDRGTRLTATLDGAPQHGTVELAADGSYVYQPRAGFSGTDSFTYTATDASGQAVTGLVTVTVLPDAVDDDARTAAGTPVTVGAPGVLGNDHGSDLTAALVDAPAHGTATIAPGGTVTYVPADGFSGTDAFTYRATDGRGGSDVATVTVHVGPVVVDDEAPGGGTLAGQPLVVPADQGVLANDRGVDLTVTPTEGQGPRAGTVELRPDGSYTYTPAPGTSGRDSFGYTVTDGAGNEATGTVTVVVRPVAVDDDATVDAGRTVTVAAPGVLGNDRGTGLTAAVTTAPQHGTVTIAPDGTFTYVPADGFSGDDTVGYVVTDREGASAAATVTVTVSPRAVDDAYETAADETLVVPAAGVLGDDLGSGLTVTSVGTAAHGTATIDADGALTYVPATGTSGTDRFPYEVTDASGRTATATVTVLVGPRATDDVATTRAGEVLTVAARDGVLANDSGTGLTATVDAAPGHGTVELARDGSYAYTPADGFSGRDSFTYTATDAAGQGRVATVTVTVAPVAVDDRASVDAGRTVTVSAPGVLGNDRGTGLTAVVTTAPQHGTVTIGPDGTFTYAPADGFSGTDTIGYTVTDRDGGSASATVTVTVAPRALDDAFETPADTTLVVSAPGVLGDDLGSGLTVTSVGSPAHGTATIDADGALTYVPAPGTSGTDRFPYEVADASGRTATATVTVLVGARATDDTGTTRAGEVLTVAARDGVLANDSGTGLTATVDAAPGHGTVELARDGSYAYTPADGFSGQDSFTYTATDAQGQVRTGRVVLTVTPVAVDDATTTTAGTPRTVAAPGVLGNDLGTGLRVTSVGSAAHGAVTIDAAGAATYAPADGFSGDDTVAYTVTDRDGGTASATVTVTVTPLAVDDAHETPAGTTLVVPAPGVLGNDLGTGLTVTSVGTAAHGSATIDADGALTYVPATGTSGPDAVTYGVTDASGRTATATVTVLVGVVVTDDAGTTRAGVVLTVDARGGVLANDAGTGLGAALADAPRHGTVELARDGSYAYAPAEGFSGRDSFTYTATDAAGQARGATVTVTVTPVAVDDATTTTAGTPRTVVTPGVLGNDLGTDLTVATVGIAAHGTVTIDATGTFTYAPAAGFSGVDTVEYGVVDAADGTDVATVTVTVLPAAVDGSATTVAGRTLTVDRTDGVLARDSGTELTASLAEGASHGTVTLAGDGSYVYVPAAGFTGTDSFDYVATDASGQTATATVTITVLGAATATDDTARGETGRPTTVDVTANDAATQGATFDRGTVVVVDPATQDGVSELDVPGQGTWTVVDGQVVFTPADGFEGRASVAYRVTDTASSTVQATVTVRYPLVLTPAQLAFTGGASVLGTAAFALLGVALGLGLARRRRGTGPVAGPRRGGDRD